jgi:pimeloyl-ACP methyl ester carboxylesterase
MSAPITCLHYPAPGGAAEILLVMLPGAGIAAADFAAHGMIDAVRAKHLPVDITVAHPDIGLYLEDGVTAVLHEQVILPALARGITRIWLLGISLGGMGALLYTSMHQQNIEGLCLIAPFIGTRGTTAELARAGGLAPWRAETSTATDAEQRLLLWLQAHLCQPASAPALYLGYALADRFAPAHKFLAQHLPRDCVAVTEGGHDWPSWRALWGQLLALAPFAGRCHAQ